MKIKKEVKKMEKRKTTKKSALAALLTVALCAFAALALIFGGGAYTANAAVEPIEPELGTSYCSATPTDITLSDIAFKKVTSTDSVIYRFAFKSTVDITPITKTSAEAEGNIANCTGALEFYVFLNSSSNPSALECRLGGEWEDSFSGNERAQISWNIANSFNKGQILKFTLPFSKATYRSGDWSPTKDDADGGLGATLTQIAGFRFVVLGINSGDELYVSPTRFIESDVTEIKSEVIPFGAPSLSVAGMIPHCVAGDTVALKPTMVIPPVYTTNSIKYKVEKKGEDSEFAQVGEDVTVATDADYNYEFTEAGEYKFTYTLNATLIGGEAKDYVIAHNISVVPQAERVLVPSAMNKLTNCISDVVEVTLNDIDFHMVRNTTGNLTFGADLRVDGETLDITSFTGDTSKGKPMGAMEFYVYFEGSNPTSVELRLDRELEDSASWMRYHQSWQPAMQSGKLVKYTVPFCLGNFSEGGGSATYEKASADLYNQVSGFMLQLVNSQGLLLVSDLKLITTTAVTEIKTEEIAIEAPVIIAEKLPDNLITGEKADFKPIVIAGGGASLSVSVSGDNTVAEFTPATDDDWSFALENAGDCTVTYKLAGGEPFEATKNITVIEYAEREINKDKGFYNGKSSFDGGARYYDDVTYRYIKVGKDADTRNYLQYAWFRVANADNNQNDFGITDMPIDAMAIEMYIYASFGGNLDDAEVRIGNCTNSYYDYGWTHKYWSIKSLQSGKLAKLTLRLSDAGLKQTDAQLVWDAINSMVIYIKTDGLTENDYMLVSDFKVFTTAKDTSLEVIDDNFEHDLTVPTVTAPECDGGEYDQKYNLVPTVAKADYTGKLKVNVTISYGEENVLKSFDYEGTESELPALMSADLAEYSFPTGREYTVTVTVSDVFGNSASDSSTVVITGTPPDVTKPEIDTSAILTSVKRGDTVDLTLAVITDDMDAGSDIAVVYTVKIGEKNITVNAGKFVANEVGTFTVTIKATDTSGNAEIATIDIVAAKKTDTAPVITVPESFVTSYNVNGQVNLAAITAKAEDGADAAVSFTVKGPNGADVEVKNNKFTFSGAGEYVVTVTATDADGNTASKEVKVTAKAAETESGGKKKKCGSFAGSEIAALGWALIASSAAVIAFKRKKNYEK